MGKLTIIGNARPVIGTKEMYSVSSANDRLYLTNISLQPPKVEWGIMVQTKTGWQRAKNDKEGQRVPYTFGQKSLLHREIKIIVQQGKDKSELIVHPQRAKEPKISKVELLDANYQPIPKGRKISYRDTIIARAYGVEMFKMRVSFTLWEDDAQGEGHNPIINAMNRINLVPVFGTVNEKGVAEAVFRLSAYTMAVQIANARTASGDKDEGTVHEYYVTAEMANRNIQKASPNVNVINPTYNPSPPRQREMPKGHAPLPKKSKPVPQKAKPKEETAKFPQTSAAKKQADPDGKILSAEFTDGTGKPLKNAQTGDGVSIKIIAQNMKGKNVKVRIWEEDFLKWSHDLLYEKSVQIIGNTNFINDINLTKDMFAKGYDVGDKNQLEYFIEVEHNNTSVTSAVMNVTLDASQTEVPKGRSVSVVEESKQEKDTNTCVCKEYDLIWGGHPNVKCEFRKKVVEICKDLWGEKNKIQMGNNLMAVFRWESGATFKPDAPNQANSGGTGLIQFMPSTAESLLGKKITVENVKNYYGKKYNKKTKQKEDWYLKRIKEFADMTAVQQLDYVKKYFEPLRNKTVEFVDFYLQVLFPASSLKENHIVFASSLDKLTTRTNESEKLRNLRISAYVQNNGLDINKDGTVWKSEIKTKVQVYITEGMVNKENNFECRKNDDKKTLSEVSSCPKDGSQCLNYADVWENPTISSDNGGKNNNRFDKGSSRGHKGVDIISGSTYKDVHSLMCGKVEKIITSFKTNQYGEKKLGNVINIKSKDKDGNIVYVLYCHLDKVYIKEGELIKHGQKIALSGSTGNASDGSLPNGVLGRGINKENWHIHIESCSNGSGAVTFFGKDRLQPEDYMKTKFDNKGNAIK